MIVSQTICIRSPLGDVRICRDEVGLVRGSRSAAVSLLGQVIGEKGELPIVLDGGQRQI